MQVSDSSSRILASLLEARTGQQLTMNRRWRIETALSQLLRERRITSLDELITILVMGKEPALATEVVEALLNNETYFFRDRVPFDTLSDKLLPLLVDKRRDNKRLAIWSAGCSTGQETYSLAMMFAEQPLKWQGWTIDIVGTDVSSTCVDRARSGTYTQFEVQRGLGVTQMIRWFAETDDGWRAAEPLRNMVRFENHNLLERPPHPRQFDVILCRNVLLYLSPEKRRQAFDCLASALSSDGALMLGAGETVIGQTERFAADREVRGFYRHADHPQTDRRSSRVA
jgi:chemotaxis protein methyltransferase CheR